jgi:hypothetical protein
MSFVSYKSVITKFATPYFIVEEKRHKIHRQRMLEECIDSLCHFVRLEPWKRHEKLKELFIFSRLLFLFGVCLSVK